jgi:hypothetical protein
MGIAKKRRKKISVEGRIYLWWVQDDRDSNDMVLHVASEDKAFLVKYHLNQPEHTRHIIIMGRRFAGVPEAGGPWVRVLCPLWEDAGIIRPSAIRRLIDWAYDARQTRTRVDWLGRTVQDNNG